MTLILQSSQFSQIKQSHTNQAFHFSLVQNQPIQNIIKSMLELIDKLILLYDSFKIL